MRIGDMLFNAKVITDLQLNAALTEQQRWGGKLGQILVRMGALTEDLLVSALCRQLDLPRADLDAIKEIPAALKERLDRSMCERYHVLPLAYVSERRALQLAMSDPFDVVATDDLTRRLGTRIEPFLAGDTAIATAIRRLYSAMSSTSFAPSSAEEMPFIDNAGNARSAAPAAAPAATVQSVATPAVEFLPEASAQFAARVEEQVRAVRAVAALLVERGVIRHDELQR